MSDESDRERLAAEEELERTAARMERLNLMETVRKLQVVRDYIKGPLEKISRYEGKLKGVIPERELYDIQGELHEALDEVNDVLADLWNDVPD